jgi:leucyl aminopeptidase
MELPKIELIGENNNLVETLKSQTSKYDGLIVIFTDKDALIKVIPSAQKYIDLDASFGSSIQLIIPDDAQPAKRILIAPTGTLLNDFDDVRRFKGNNRN